ncbi:retrovirus-related pol polyprotein from transposon TNT 1-94 [Tanacetum coccineum]
MHQHMTGNLKLLCNFIEKYLGSVRFGNDQFSPILGYGDLVQGNITIKRVYYVGGLNHNLFSVGQFYDADLEDQLCFSCELGKAKRSTFKTKTVPSSKGRLNLFHMDLCGPMRIEIINGKKYILVIVDDYSRYTWTHFLRTKDETPEASNYDNSGLALQLQKTSDHNRLELETHDHSNEPSSSKLVPNDFPSANTIAPSLQELDLFYNPLYDEFFTTRNSSILESSSPSDNSQQQDMPPISNVHTTIEPITPTTTINAEENNNDIQAENA